MRYRSCIGIIMAEGRVPPKKFKSVVFNNLGGKTTVKKIHNKKTTLKHRRRRGQRGMVEDQTFIFFLDPSLS